jgi:hypothetical protein
LFHRKWAFPGSNGDWFEISGRIGFFARFTENCSFSLLEQVQDDEPEITRFDRGEIGGMGMDLFKQFGCFWNIIFGHEMAKDSLDILKVKIEYGVIGFITDGGHRTSLSLGLK